MSIDGICVQVRGNVQLGVSLARNSIWRTSTKGEAHFCISRVRNAVAPNKKAASRRFKFCWGNIAAHIRSLNLLERSLVFLYLFLLGRPFWGILVRLRGNCIIRFRVNFCCTIQNVLVDECQAVALENVIDVNPVDAVMHRWREEVDVS